MMGMAQSRSHLSLLAIACLGIAHRVAAQTGDGGAASGNIIGQNTNGAAGPSQSSANLSTGATVAIAIVVAIVVFVGVFTAYLFFSAKRRQWTLREQLRHSRRRVTTGLKAIAAPLTPGRGILSPVKTRFSAKETTGLRDESPGPTKSKTSRNFSRVTRAPVEEDTIALRVPDLEKGGPPLTATHPTSSLREGNISKSKGLKGNMRIELPKNWPSRSGAPETPMGKRFFGRS